MLVLAQENAVIEGYTVEGVDNDGNAYNTVIKDVEQVSLLSDDATYFGTGEISGAQEDIYQLIVGGQGDLGEMLYVETGETLTQRLVLVLTLLVLTSSMVKFTIVVIIQILIEILLIQVNGLKCCKCFCGIFTRYS